MKFVITKRDRAILIGLFGLLVLAAVYYFVYMGYKDKTAQLKQTNAAIQNRIDVLQSIADQQAQLIDETNANNATVDTIFSRFPSNIYEEDIILFARALEDFAPFEQIPNVGIGAPQEMYTFEDIKAQTDEEVNGYIPAEVGGNGVPATEESTSGEEGTVEAPSDVPLGLPTLYTRTCTVAGYTDYDGFKNALRFVIDNLDRSNMVVNASYDITTGTLQASLNIGRYYVTGTDKPYVEPDIRDVIQGTDNMFGTIPLSESRTNNRKYTPETNTR